MRVHYLSCLLSGLMILCGAGIRAQNANCFDGTVTGSNTYSGTVFFNYGGVVNAFTVKNKTTLSVGEPLIGPYFGQQYNGVAGFYSRFLLPPTPPAVSATEGDLKDRIQINWTVDPLSPSPEQGFNVYRDGAFIGHVDKEIRLLIDFNVQAGQFYNYQVSGVNAFGEGSKGNSLGFLNPNGVVTGQVRTFSGNPVEGAGVVLTPTLGTALEFSGDDVAFAEFDSALIAPSWSLSCWVKIGAGNNDAAILDFGSNLQKNWWLTTNGTSKGVKINVGNGTATKTASAGFGSNPDGWHHVAATYSGASLLLYLDGNLVTTLSPAPLVNDTLPLFFGRKAGAMSNYFNGSLDDVRIFRRQLSQTEINQYKNRTVNSDAEGLGAYWKFDEGVGTKGYDISEKRLKTYLCGPAWTSDRPDVINGAVTDESGFYKIEGINYGSGTTFTATPSKTAYDNYALEFNAVNGNYAVLTDSVLPAPQNAAIELRLQSFENVAAARTVLANQSSGGGNFFQINLIAGNLNVVLGTVNKSFGALGAGYQHIVVNLKKNGASTDISLYKNGALVSTQNYAGTVPNFGPQSWQIGARKTVGGYDQFFSGLIDEVAFYDTLLSLPEIQLNHVKGADATHPHLRSWFPLNESRGNEIEDIGPARTGIGSVQGALWSTVTGIVSSTEHVFQPDKRLLTLNASNTSTDQVDFTDLSTIAVSGYVRFDGTDCFAEGVEILVDGESASPKIWTDSTGKFVADFEPGTSVVLTPRLGEHTFAPASWQLKNLNAPVAGILFRDLTKRSLRGRITGGLCEKGLLAPGQSIVVKVATPGVNPCFERTFTLNGDADGGDKNYVFGNLPPRPLNVSIVSSNPTTFYNYFQSKGGETVDLSEASDTVDFNYVAPPEIEVVEGLPLNHCNQPMVEQLLRYNMRFKVYQDYAGGKCYLDEAQFSFSNELADAAAFDTLMGGGTLRYSFRAGSPNLAAPYQKTLTVQAMQYDSQTRVLNLPAVVLGQSPTGTTFAATAPQIPFMVLHDPPGDASSAYMEKGSTTCRTLTMAVSDANSGGFGTELSLGYTTEIAAGVGILTITETELVNTLSFGLTYSASETRENSVGVCLSTNEILATNGADNLIGRDADVFLGAALNFDFGINNILKLDTSTCGYFIDKGLIGAISGVSTTYIYQRYDIENVIIPNLLLSGLPTAAADIARWQQILADDDARQASAVFEENISFTGGVYYEKSITTERTESKTESFEKTLDIIAGEELGYTANNAGFVARIEYAYSKANSDVVSEEGAASNTVGYSLNDDDIGDLFSVNVKKDRLYGTPVFQLVSGETSCPWEAPTQKRNFVSFTANTTAVANVNSNAAAVFNLSLGNQSETDEEQTYTLAIGANPLGAIVKAEGQQLTAQGLEFTIPAGQSLPVLLTVERGNLSYNYQDIEVILAASCEDSGVEGFAKSLLLDVEFVEPCSEVDIAFPMQNDVIVAATPNPFQVTVDDYDKNDPDLELIRIQYRPKFGDGSWINIQPQSDILKANLNPVSTTVPWSVGTLNDGPYELRALTQCFGGNQAPGISKVIGLRVERQPPALLGLPQPSDGILSQGDEISISFNEEINCATLIQADIFDNNNIGLYDTETGNLIDATISCFENKIVIVPNIQNYFIEGKTLRVEVDNVEDLAGNMFVHTDWEFYVNRSPLNLDGGDLDVTMYEGTEKIVLRDLANVSGSIAAFEIAGTPDWVNIFPNIGSLLPGESVTVTYKFSKTLPQGEYTDTIWFNNSQGNERVIIRLRVLCAAPDWTFDAAAYPHSMNMTAQLNIEGFLSEDEADQVAAFIDGELRGTGQLQYLPVLDQYMAFMTIYGQAADQNKPVEIEIWDASDCLRYGDIEEQFIFEVDHVIGTVGSPQVLHTSGQVRRDIPLATGWNWISFNLDFDDPALNPVLASLDHPANDLIKGQSAFAEYFSGNWLGSLSAVNNMSLFQFRADQPDTIRMTGGLIDPATVNIPVSAGWNWIGYVPNYALPVSEALAGLNPLNGDLIKGQTAFAQYLAGFGWLGSLQFLEAPKGYQLKISNPGILAYPDNIQGSTVESRGGQPAQSAYWTLDPTSFEHSMTLVGMFSDTAGNATLASHEIGAFAGSELRGASQAIYIEPLQAYLFFLTIYSNTSGEPLHFKLYDSTTGQISDLAEQLYFAANLHQGEIQEPVPFTEKTSSTAIVSGDAYLRVLPNPFHDAALIHFSAGAATDATLAVSDVAGRELWRQNTLLPSGPNMLRWDAAGVQSGVYFVRLETTEGVWVKKVVKE